MKIDLKRVQHVFLSVTESPPAERAAVLGRECGSDAVLRKQVESLLEAHDDSVELPAVELTGACVPVIETGCVVAGRFKLREKLGEGGMGVVFVADQTEPQRRVALKILRSGLDTQKMLARFEQERQALALMDHPNIAKIFDAGTDESSRPYFAMELIKGLPLTKYCDEGKLTSRQRIELFIPVCQAVQHAHQKGIIHRDLKPSNILVGLYDGRAVPKVIDFGVAKVTGQRLTDQSVYTEVGSLIGTLEYMSPEQAELNNLDIDTRSDIYALGVILYELLTGAVPFNRKELERASLMEMLRVIKEVEPSKPSTRLSNSGTLLNVAARRQTDPKKLTALVRGELDWIVMKALEKDRSRRYDTANGLALDVQRYLNGEPVLAAPTSTLYRMQKFVRRNMGTVLAASLIVLALLLGIAGTTWGLLRAEKQREVAESNAVKANAALAAEKEAKARADANYTIAKEAVEKYLTTITDDPDLRNADFNKLRKRLLESALPFFKRITEQKDDDPHAEGKRAEALGRLSLIYSAMGDNETALKIGQDVVAIARSLRERHPHDLRNLEYLAIGYQLVSQCAQDLCKYRDAENAIRQAVKVNEELVAAEPASAIHAQNLASCLYTLGGVLWSVEDYPGAVTAYRQSVITFDKIHPDPDNQLLSAKAHNDLGVALKDLGQINESEKECRLAQEILEKLVANFPGGDPDYRGCLAANQSSLGNTLMTAKRLKEAETVYREVLALRVKLYADFPSEPEREAALARAQGALGLVLTDLGRFEEARAVLSDALAIDEKLVVKFPAMPTYRFDLGETYGNMDLVLEDLKKWKEAEDAVRRAIEITERLLPEYGRLPKIIVPLAGYYNNYGRMIAFVDKKEEALSWCSKGIALLEPLAAGDPSNAQAKIYLRNNYYNFARALERFGKHGDANLNFERALKLDDGTYTAELRKGAATSLLRASQERKDSAGCLAAIMAYEALNRTQAGDLYDTACFRAVCAAAFRQDSKTASADASKLAEEQAGIAMTWLHKAVAAGYKDAGWLEKDSDLDALRDRSDFKELLAKLKAER